MHTSLSLLSRVKLCFSDDAYLALQRLMDVNLSVWEEERRMSNADLLNHFVSSHFVIVDYAYHAYNVLVHREVIILWSRLLQKTLLIFVTVVI